jgi:hypothetical protein
MELTGLSSDIEYEVRLRAMNSQGWSQLSNPFLFRTAGTDRNPSPILLNNSRAMNSQGWSQLSNPFLFRTAGTDRNPSPILLKNSRAMNSQGWSQL